MTSGESPPAGLSAEALRQWWEKKLAAARASKLPPLDLVIPEQTEAEEAESVERAKQTAARYMRAEARRPTMQAYAAHLRRLSQLKIATERGAPATVAFAPQHHGTTRAPRSRRSGSSSSQRGSPGRQDDDDPEPDLVRRGLAGVPELRLTVPLEGRVVAHLSASSYEDEHALRRHLGRRDLAAELAVAVAELLALLGGEEAA